MAITPILVALTLVVTISDGLMGQPNFGFGELFPQVRYIPALQVPQPRALPGFPQINLPQPPPLPVFTFNNPYENHNKESFQNEAFKLPFYPVPTMETTRNEVPNPNHSFQTFLYSSSSNSKGQGVAKILVDQNGETFQKTFYFPADTQEKPANDA